MVFRDQVLVFARPGMIPGAALEDLVDKVKALDMDDVRKKIAEQEKAEDQEQTADGEEARPEPRPAVTARSPVTRV